MESVLGAEVERAAPASVGAGVPSGGTLPRAGGGFGTGLLRLIAFLGVGRALFGLPNGRRAVAGANLVGPGAT